MAEAFQKAHEEDVDIRVNKSGTGPGFEKFARGETEINDASRPIKETEAAKLKEAGIGFVELQVAIDGLSVVIHPDNDWAETLSVEHLAKIWGSDSSVKKWNDVDPSWPDEEIKLYGPDSESGTYDYFLEAVIGKEGQIRTDYQESVDDNILARMIAEEKYALGYFGYAYLSENKGKLKGVAIAPGSDLSAAVAPTPETIENGSYSPLSRPLFIYVRTDALARPEVADFVKFYLSEQGQEEVRVKYVPLSNAQLQESLSRLEAAIDAN